MWKKRRNGCAAEEVVPRPPYTVIWCAICSTNSILVLHVNRITLDVIQHTDAGWDEGGSEHCWCCRVAGDNHNWRGKYSSQCLQCVKLPWRSTREMTGLRSQYDSQLLRQDAPAGLDAQWIPLKWQITDTPSETLSDPSSTLCEDESSDRAVEVLLFLIIQIKRPGEQNNADWDYWGGLDGYLLLQKQIREEIQSNKLWISNPTGESVWSVCLSVCPSQSDKSFSFFCSSYTN